MQTFEHRPSPRDARIAELTGIALSRGSLINERYRMRISNGTPEVWVWECMGQPDIDWRVRLVAYSSMESDRVSSIEEFVSDFFA
jgi:hypothetical protein